LPRPGRVLARAVKAAKLDAPAPTFHDLRHPHASGLIAAGMDVQSVADRLGHANIAVTQSTYAHEFDAAARSPERRAMLEAVYGKPMAGSDGGGAQQTATLTVSD